jgi:diaminobutyrate-2-oxoglutarate transaminase
MGLPFAALLIKPEYDISARPSTTARSAATTMPSSRRASRWRNSGPTTAFRRSVNERKAGFWSSAWKMRADMLPNARLKGRGMMRGVDVGSGELAGDDLRRVLRKRSDHRNVGRL